MQLVLGRFPLGHAVRYICAKKAQDAAAIVNANQLNVYI